MRPPGKKARRHPGATGAASTSGSGGSGGGSDEVVRALSWLNSYPEVSRWMARYDIEALVEAAGGLCVIKDFLPPAVAEGALRILERLPKGRWRATEADEDYTHNNIAHAFWSVKGGIGGGGEQGGGSAGEDLEALLRAFSLLRPKQFNAFSAARYDDGHHIAPHDDRAYTPVQLDTGEVISCSRDLTCVYYLTKDWQASWGGALVDLEAPPEGHMGGAAAADGASGWDPAQHPQQRTHGRVYVPKFNSAVFFKVPHYHTVTPLTTDRPRYSVFGWYLQPGKLYDLYTGEEEAQQAQQQGQRQQQGQLPAPTPQPHGGVGAAAEQHSHEDHQQQAQQQGQQQGGQQQAGAAPKKGKKRRREGRQAQQQHEGPPQCKLAQRLLARLAAKRAGREPEDGEGDKEG